LSTADSLCIINSEPFNAQLALSCTT